MQSTKVTLRNYNKHQIFVDKEQGSVMVVTLLTCLAIELFWRVSSH
jgi:hypothetical protein